jgi:hypothetical protein
MTAARTTRRSPAARVLALGAAIGVGLTGCSGGGGGGEPSDDETPLGAIDKLFEGIYADWDEDRANAESMRMEELVAECMAREGFEYIPVDWSQGGMVISEDDDIPWGTLEFAEQWGYGITTNPWEDQQPVDPEPGQEFVDPNQAIIEAMSPTEQEAYYAALYGTFDWSTVDEGEVVEPSWEELGCSGWAQHEVWGDNVWGGDENEWSDLMDEMQRMWEAIEDDPRVTEAHAAWASCMADAGYSGLAKVGDAEQSFYDRVNPIWENAYADIPPDAGEEEWRAAEEEVQRQLAALTEEEIATAVADYKCRESSGYDKKYQEANLAAQQRFYDEHKEELEAYAAAERERVAGTAD